MWNLLGKELSARRGAIVGWGLGLALYGWAIMALFPSMAEQFGGIEFPEFYKAFGDINNLGTLEGWLPLEILDWIPLLLGILAITAGTAVLAGEEDSGTLELLLSLPLPRWQLVVVKTIVLALVMLIILLLMFLGLWLGLVGIQDEIETGLAAADLLRASLNNWPILMLWTTLSLFLGAYLPRRRHAAVGVTLYLVVSYLVHTLGNVSEKIEPLQPYFPFHYYASREALTGRWVDGNPWLLLGVAGILLVLTMLSFQRRNVTVGAWPWARARVS